jgi:hypothetical protein
MKACWPEGSLRAYHDGELLPADMELIAAHLAECPHCEALADEVAGRASRVAKLMSALPPTEQVIWMPRRVAAPVRARAVKWPVWAGAAVALAAGIAVATWMAPKPEEYRAVAPRATPAGVKPEVPEVQAGIPAIRPGVRPAAAEHRMTPVSRRPVQRAPRKQLFLALDDEPIETGIVVRVALGEAEIPADVIFGTDGRAHAIRLVSNPTK